MLYWYPKIKDLPIPQPKTGFVLKDEHWWDYLDGRQFSKKDMSVLKKAMVKIGYPIFMRTDLASGKHQYLRSSYVEKRRDVQPALYNLIEQNALRDLFFNTIIIREFLYLDYRFKAFDGLPIAPERRYFIKDGKVICHHPYWIEEAIQFYEHSKQWENTNWRKSLKEMNTESEVEVKILSNHAELVGTMLDGYWSIDFAKDKSGTWWLIDMALGEKSWHPCCKNKLTTNLKGS